MSQEYYKLICNDTSTFRPIPTNKRHKRLPNKTRSSPTPRAYESEETETFIREIALTSFRCLESYKRGIESKGPTGLFCGSDDDFDCEAHVLFLRRVSELYLKDLCFPHRRWYVSRMMQLSRTKRSVVRDKSLISP
jgi:hypothetical protein